MFEEGKACGPFSALPWQTRDLQQIKPTEQLNNTEDTFCVPVEEANEDFNFFRVKEKWGVVEAERGCSSLSAVAVI